MKFTLSWLKDHLETEADVHQIAEAMTMAGLEVEEVLDPAAKLAPFTVAKILSAERHPNADRLQVCQVETVDGIKEIVCGAPNARAGLTTIYAPIGAMCRVWRHPGREAGARRGVQRHAVLGLRAGAGG